MGIHGRPDGGVRQDARQRVCSRDGGDRGVPYALGSLPAHEGNRSVGGEPSVGEELRQDVDASDEDRQGGLEAVAGVRGDDGAGDVGAERAVVCGGAAGVCHAGVQEQGADGHAEPHGGVDPLRMREQVVHGDVRERHREAVEGRPCLGEGDRAAGWRQQQQGHGTAGVDTRHRQADGMPVACADRLDEEVRQPSSGILLLRHVSKGVRVRDECQGQGEDMQDGSGKHTQDAVSVRFVCQKVQQGM